MEPQQESHPQNPQSLTTADARPELNRHECAVCGYVYEPEAGDPKRGIAGGTPFAALPADWRCPVCNSRASAFKDIGPKEKPSGFSENLGYGFGVNRMTPAQKNLLIFGGLALAFLIFMSGYALN